MITTCCSCSCSGLLQAAVPHTPIVLGRAALRRLRPGEVLVRRWPNSCLPAQWFRLLDEDQPVVVGSCGHFFEAEEYEMVSRHSVALQLHVSVVLQQVLSTVTSMLPGSPDGSNCTSS